jgi:hypothetical protein
MLDVTNAFPPMKAEDPTFDNTPSLNRLLEDTDNTLFIPEGSYYFLTPPKWCIRQV